MHSMSANVTELLDEWRNGDEAALEHLIPMIHQQLMQLACRHFQGERQSHTLQPTALVNEAFLRLLDQKPDRWQSRQHFFAIASRLMRRILVDHTRQRRAAKRQAQAEAMPFDEVLVAAPEAGVGVVDILLLDTALEELAARDPRLARIVELRYFGGLTIAETSKVLGLSAATVKTDWQLAKARLWQRLTRSGEQ